MDDVVPGFDEMTVYAPRMVIARKIRALFHIEDGKLVLLILRIGQRKDIYE